MADPFGEAARKRQQPQAGQADPFGQAAKKRAQQMQPPGIPKPPLPPGLTGQGPAWDPASTDAWTNYWSGAPPDPRASTWTNIRHGAIPDKGVVGSVLTMPRRGSWEAAEGAGDIKKGISEGDGRRVAGGASKVFRGTTEAIAPLALPLAIAEAPIAAPVAIAAGGLAGWGAEKGLRAAGMPAEYSALLGDLASIVGGGVGPKLGGALLSRMRGAPNPAAAAAEVVKFADDNRIPLNAAARSGIERLRRWQAQAAGSKAAQRSQQATQGAMARTAETIRGGPADIPEVAGGGVAQSLQAAKERYSRSADAAYSQLREIEANNQQTVVTGNRRVDTGLVDPRTKQPIIREEPITENIGLPVNIAQAKASLAPIVSRITDEMPLAQRQASTGLQALNSILNSPDTLSATTLDSGLSAIKSILREPSVSPRSRYLLRQALDQLEPTIDRAVAQGGPEAVRALAEGRQLTRAKYAAEGTMRRLKVRPQDEFALEPVKVFQTLTTPGDAHINMLRRVRIHAPDSLPAVGRTFLEGLFDSALGRDGNLNPKAALNAWNKLGDSSKSILFQPQQVTELDRFFRLAELVEKQTPRAQLGGTNWTRRLVEAAVGLGPELAFHAIHRPGAWEATVPLAMYGVKLGYGAGKAAFSRTMARALWDPRTARLLTKEIRTPWWSEPGAVAGATGRAVADDIFAPSRDQSGAARPSTTRQAPTEGTPETANLSPFITAPRAGVTPQGLTPDLRRTFADAGRRYGVSPALLMAMAKQESAGDPRAVSPKGARGLMQFMPDTAAQYGVDPFDPVASVDGAAHFMSDLLKKYHGNRRLALAAYNAGEGVVDDWLKRGQGIQYKETRDYVNKILSSLQ